MSWEILFSLIIIGFIIFLVINRDRKALAKRNEAATLYNEGKYEDVVRLFRNKFLTYDFPNIVAEAYVKLKQYDRALEIYSQTIKEIRFTGNKQQQEFKKRLSDIEWLKIQERNKPKDYTKTENVTTKTFEGNTIERKEALSFTAIDFETANSEPSSVCALGVVSYENGIKKLEKSWLIKPVPNVFLPFNISLHNIAPHDVENAPTFKEIWNEVKPHLENNLVIAHNVSFDLKCLKAVASMQGIELPDFRTACTLELARNHLNLHDNKLPTIAKHFKISLKHHDALSDALACAEIFLQISSGNLAEVDSKPTHTPNKSNPFYGKRFVFTGTLKELSRDMAEHYVILYGGETAKSVSKKVDYLVEGRQDSYKIKGDSSSKQEKAKDLQDSGHHIKIINEKQFMEILDIARASI